MVHMIPGTGCCSEHGSRSCSLVSIMSEPHSVPIRKKEACPAVAWHVSLSCGPGHSVISRVALGVGGSSFWWNGEYPGLWAPGSPGSRRLCYTGGYSDVVKGVSE